AGRSGTPITRPSSRHTSTVGAARRSPGRTAHFSACSNPSSDPRWALRSLVPAGEVLLLLLGELVDVDAHGRKLEAGDLAADLVRHRVALPLERSGILHGVLRPERLVRERHVHDESRVALGRAEVDEPALGYQVETPPVGHRELLDELARVPRLGRQRAQ